MANTIGIDDSIKDLNEPLLLAEEYLDDELHVPLRKASHLNTCLFSIFINLICISVYTILFFVASASYYRDDGATAIHPLPGLEFNYIAQKFIYVEASPFSGPPSPSVDGAWHDLLRYTTLRASASELESSNQTSVELPEGGHLVWLHVFHHLHCIKLLRQWKYREHYYPDVPEEDRAHREIHLDHCLDLLRSAIMCNADSTLTTFEWADNPKPMLNTKRVDHKCIDWDRLMESVENRVVDDEEMSRLVHPTMM